MTPETLVEYLADAVAEHYGIEADSILSHDRDQVTCSARNVLYRILRLGSLADPMSTPEVAALVGSRCHTSVIRALRKQPTDYDNAALVRVVAAARDDGFFIPGPDRPAVEQPKQQPERRRRRRRGQKGIEFECLWDQDPEVNLAMRRVRRAPGPLRAETWLAACRRLYPYSWQHQAAVLPRGVQA